MPDQEIISIGQSQSVAVSEWDAWVSSVPNVSFFHSTAWMQVLHRTYGFSPIFAVEGRPSAERSFVLLMEVNSWITGRRGISLPFTDECAPSCKDSGTFERMFCAILRHADHKKWKYCEFRGGRPVLPSPRSSNLFWGHQLDLRPDKTFHFSLLDSSTRRAVRRAEQSKLVVEFSTTVDVVRSFYVLLCKTRQRHGLPPQPVRFFDNIQRHILAQDKGIVVLATFNKIPVAGAIFFHRGADAIYKFGASDSAFRHLRANNLIMWRAIDWHAHRGYTTLDFGRTSRDNDGLRRFKLAWGTKERTIEYFKYNHQRMLFVTSHDKTRGWHNRLFRMMPQGLSKLVGAAVYRHVA